MKTITIRGEKWDVEYVQSMLHGMQPGEFQRTAWTRRDALVAKDGSRATIYTGQPFDSSNMTIKHDYWDHDHCEVCNWLFIDTEGVEHSSGYFNGYNWLCDECYRLFILEKRVD